MEDKDIIARHVKFTETTSMISLSILDQLKLIISKFTNNEAKELDAMKKITSIDYQNIAELTSFFKESIRRMKEAGETSVVVRVSSKYLPYLDKVINDKTGMGKFYKFDVFKKDFPINIKYNFYIKISIRVEGEVKK